MKDLDGVLKNYMINLLKAQARLETLISRENVWTATSKEVDNLKKQLVLQVP